MKRPNVTEMVKHSIYAKENYLIKKDTSLNEDDLFDKVHAKLRAKIPSFLSSNSELKFSQPWYDLYNC